MIFKIITIWYLIPSLLSIVGCYKIAKRDEANVVDFIKVSALCLLPIFNVFIFIAISYLTIVYFVENSEKIQNFLNRKL